MVSIYNKGLPANWARSRHARRDVVKPRRRVGAFFPPLQFVHVQIRGRLLPKVRTANRRHTSASQQRRHGPRSCSIAGVRSVQGASTWRRTRLACATASVSWQPRRGLIGRREGGDRAQLSVAAKVGPPLLSERPNPSCKSALTSPGLASIRASDPVDLLLRD